MTYKELNRLHHVLKSASKSTAKSATARREAAGMAFEDALCKMLNNKDSLRALTRQQTWQVLSWCSSYRPEPSHLVVRKFGNLIDE
jgi:hypothetical protein